MHLVDKSEYFLLGPGLLDSDPDRKVNEVFCLKGPSLWVFEADEGFGCLDHQLFVRYHPSVWDIRMISSIGFGDMLPRWCY